MQLSRSAKAVLSLFQWNSSQLIADFDGFRHVKSSYHAPLNANRLCTQYTRESVCTADECAYIYRHSVLFSNPNTVRSYKILFVYR